MTDGATLSAAGKQLDLALVPASEGNNGYDISTLLKETGNVTLDGLEVTAVVDDFGTDDGSQLIQLR